MKVEKHTDSTPESVLAAESGQYETVGTLGDHDATDTHGVFRFVDKAVLEKNYESVQQWHLPAYRQLADRYDTTVEDIKMILQHSVEQAVDQSDFFCAVDVYGLLSIAHEGGRWKSQFETKSSNGSYDPYFRSIAERNLFGYEREMEPSKRPIYGYISDDPDGTVRIIEGGVSTNAVRQYGLVAAKVKRDVALDRATVTFADLLDRNNKTVPSPAAQPSLASFPVPRDHVVRTLKTSTPDWGSQYVEAQFHGGLHLEDVEQIHVFRSSGATSYHTERVQYGMNRYFERTGVFIPVVEC